ncbi:hypothetical protein [Leuconostoc phage LLC-1]|nr:hypothetical protein [Leuconostoc phage LLC-1]
MNVEELIEKLNKLPKDRLVKVRSDNGYRYRDIDVDFDDGYSYDAKKDIEFYEL